MNQKYIMSAYNRFHVLEINAIEDHDIEINTLSFDVDNIQIGQAVRVYAWSGSRTFDELFTILEKAFSENTDLVKYAEMPGQLPEICETVAYKEEVTDKAILKIYQDQVGHIGIQTIHSDFAEATGPIVWLSLPSFSQSADMALQTRAEIFKPLFEVTKVLAEKLNMPEVQ